MCFLPACFDHDDIHFFLFSNRYVTQDAPDVTHIIIERFAHIGSTKKFLKNRKQSKDIQMFVVMEDWLRDSCFLLARQDEFHYQIRYLWQHPRIVKRKSIDRPPTAVYLTVWDMIMSIECQREDAVLSLSVSVLTRPSSSSAGAFL